MKVIYNALTGSRLHGLGNDESDRDYMGVCISPLVDILSPFKKLEPRIEQTDGANRSYVYYELNRFCKLAMSCNPTVLEMLFSPKHDHQTMDIFRPFLRNKELFLDSQKILDAHLGYANQQRKRIAAGKEKHKIAKHYVAWIRVLLQGIWLLKKKNFEGLYPLSDCIISPGDRKKMLMEVKYEFDEVRHPIKCEMLIQELEQRLKSVAAQVNFQQKVEPIEELLLNAYSARRF